MCVIAVMEDNGDAALGEEEEVQFSEGESCKVNVFGSNSAKNYVVFILVSL